MTDVTNDLTKFGYRELDMAADLLKAYANGKGDTSFLGDGVQVWFNANSGYVFLSDEDYNVGMLEDGEIVQFYNCPECGYEGTESEAKDNDKSFVEHDNYCSKECQDKNN